MSIATLRPKTDAPILVVGNLEPDDAATLRAAGADYVDEREIDVSGRLPAFEWTEKYREAGWYRQMFYRLSIDRYVDTDQAVILDSEVFVFDNWDERRLYDPATGHPRCFYWIPAIRKPTIDYRLYRGAAYLLSFLPGLEGAMAYADSNAFHRHISGVVLFSTANVAALWQRLEEETDLERNLNDLFNHQPELSFSDHDFYGIAVDYGLFDHVVPTVPHDNPLGWSDNHDDPVMETFRRGAMWSMCQRYFDYPTPAAYSAFMEQTAHALGARLPVAVPSPGRLATVTGPDASVPDRPEPVPGPWVLIVGMHRSNTSALAGALAAMGLTLPAPSDLVVGMPDNPNHYESSSLMAINDQLLEALDGRWDIPPDPISGWEDDPAIRPLTNAAHAAIAKTFPESGPRVWKDPRLCLLMPFWRQVLGTPLAIVFIWRWPVEVSDSLRRRGGSTTAHGLALWEHYTRSALATIEGLPVYVLDSDTLVEAPRRTCSELADWLTSVGISASGTDGWDSESGAATIQPALTHHAPRGADDLPPSQMALVEHLRALTGPHATFNSATPGKASAWSVDTLAQVRTITSTTDQLSRLSVGNKELSDAHEELIASYHELVAVAEERLTVVLALQDAVPGLKAEVAHLRGQLDRAVAEAADWKARAERAGDELAELRTSNSWKITAPLRAATTAVDRWTRPGR